MGVTSSIFRGTMLPWPPSERQNIFLMRRTVKNGISNLYIYILLKSALKMQEMPFQRPKFQNFSGGLAPGPLQLCCHYGYATGSDHLRNTVASQKRK